MTAPILLLIGLIWLAALFWARRRARRGAASTTLAADLLAGGLLFLLIGGFFWRTLTGDVYQPADGGDLVSFLFPTYRFAAGELAQGRLPLWNPHLYGGAPFFADVQAGYLYLPNLLLFLLWPQFPYGALQWLAVLNLWWAALGMYVLLRTLRLGGVQMHPAAAIAGALAFGLSDPLLIHFGNLNLIAVLAWLPWALACLDRALRAPGRGWLGWAAGAGALVAVGAYAGHAQSTLYVGLALTLYMLFWLLAGAGTPGSGGPRRRWLQGMGALAVAGGLALLLAAPLLLPVLQQVPQTERAAFAYQDTVGFSLAPMQAVGAVAPGFFGRGPALHWGLWQRVELPYVGLAALLLAAAALLLSHDAARRRDLLPWIGLAAVGLAVGLGIYAIAHGWLTAVLPFFGQLRAPARSLILFALGAAVLAGAGLDALLRAASALNPPGVAGMPPFRRLLRAGTVFWLAVALPLVYLSLLLTQESETAFLRASVAGLALAIAAGVWLAAWLLTEAACSRWISPHAFGALWVALLFFELAAAGAYTDISPQDPMAGYNHPEILAFLRSEAAQSGPFRIDTRTDIANLWQPDTAALAGLEDVGGIANPLALARWNAFWEATGGRDSDRYGLLNVKYLIARDSTPLPDNFTPALDAPGDLTVYANEDWRPRAFLAQARDGLLLPDPAQPPVQIDLYTPTHQILRTNAAAPATLVLSETWYPGWQASVNGAPAPVEQVNKLQRGVAVPAGAATVELTFAPATLRWGWLAAAAGLALLVLFLVASHKGSYAETTETTGNNRNGFGTRI